MATFSDALFRWNDAVVKLDVKNDHTVSLDSFYNTLARWDDELLGPAGAKREVGPAAVHLEDEIGDGVDERVGTSVSAAGRGPARRW